MNPAQPNSLAAWLTMRPGSLRREDLGPRAGGLRPVLCGDAMRPIPPLTPILRQGIVQRLEPGGRSRSSEDALPEPTQQNLTPQKSKEPE